MKIKLTILGLLAASSAFAGGGNWTSQPWNGGTVYQTFLSSPTTVTQPLYPGTVGVPIFSPHDLIGYAAQVSSSLVNPSLTIVGTRDVANTAAALTAAISTTVASAVTVSTAGSTGITSFSNDLGPQAGLQFRFTYAAGASAASTTLVRVYTLPNVR